MSRGFILSLILTLLASMIMFHLAVKDPPDERLVSDFEDMRDTATNWLGVYPPDFELTRLDGGTFVLSDAVGTKVVILNFFATWCGPCRSEISELERYANEHPEEVLMLGIDVKEDIEDVRQFVLHRGITYPVALDRDGLISALYEASSIPTTVVIGLDGRVLLHEPGAISNAEIAFDSLIEHSMKLAASNPSITPEEFRRASSEAGHPSGGVPEDAIPVILDDYARELASKIRCPSCSDSLLECDGGIARKLRKQLSELDTEGMTEAEVLAALFLLPEEQS